MRVVRGVAIEITHRAGCDVAYDVATGSLRGGPQAIKEADDVAQMLWTDGVELHILACGDHELSVRIAQGDITDRQVLFRGEPPARDLQAHHIAFLLLVDAKMLQTLCVIFGETCLVPLDRPSDPSR